MSLKSGIISYWQLYSNSNDVTGNGNNGTDTSISYGTTGGKASAGFNGTSSLITIPDNSGFKITTAFTVNAWIYSTSGTATQCFFSYLNTDSTTNFPYGGYLLRGLTSSSTLRESIIITKVNASGSIDVNINSPASIGLNAWHMMTITYDGSTIRVYKDGVLDSSFTTSYSSTITYLTNNYPTIGAWRYNRGSITTTSYMVGSLRDIGVWNVGLNQTQITQLYNNGNGLTYPFANSGMFQFFMR